MCILRNGRSNTSSESFLLSRREAVLAGTFVIVGAFSLAGCDSAPDPSGSWYRANYSPLDKVVLVYEMRLEASSGEWSFSQVEDGQPASAEEQIESGVLERQGGGCWIVKDHHGADWSVGIEEEGDDPVLILAEDVSNLTETFYRDIEVAREHRNGRELEEQDLRRAESERHIAEDLERMCDFNAEYPLTFFADMGLYYGPGLFVETKSGRTVDGDYLDIEFVHEPDYSVDGVWSAAWPRNTYYVNILYDVKCEGGTLYEGIVKTAGSSIELEDVCAHSGSSGTPTDADLCVFGVENDRGSLVWGIPYDVMADPYYQEAAVDLALSKGPQYSARIERIG